MGFQGIPGAHQLQAEGGPHGVFLLQGGQHLGLLFVRAHGQHVAEVAHAQGRDVGLEHQLGDVGRGGVALLQLLPNVLQLAGAPEGLGDLLLPGQLPPDEAQQAAVVDPEGVRAGLVRLQVVVQGIAEIRVVDVRFQLLRGSYAEAVPHEEPAEGAGHDLIRVQGRVQAVLLALQDHQGAAAAVEPGPADGRGDFPADLVSGLQAAQGVQLVRPQLRRQGVPAPGHVLGGHVDDPLGQPVFPVQHGQQAGRGCQRGADVTPGREQGGGFPQAGQGVVVAVYSL